MAKQTINKGNYPNDPSADKLPDAFDKVNSNFTEVYDKQDTLEANQQSGFIGYETKADMDIDTTQTDGTMGRVTNDPTASNNGLYRWDDTAGNWEKEAEFYSTDLDDTDTNEAVTGKAVGDYVYHSAQRVKEMVNSESFDMSNIVYSGRVLAMS